MTRVTPLCERLVARIRATGPLTLADYMQACLLDPQHGYYATRDPFGAGGDFTTAPEISQLFGEMLGLAIAQAWIDQGQLQDAVLAEIGPGRGTLMADLRRAIERATGWRPEVVLIEASPHLRQMQRERLGDVIHLDDVSGLPDKPLFLVANEFFDALPIRQFQRQGDGWAERMVGLAPDGRLMLGLGPPRPMPRAGAEGEIWELRDAAPPIMDAVAQRIARHGGLGIVIDYGTWDGRGDSLQALRKHAPEDPLAHPGEADLTSHVDFAPLAAAAIAAGAQVSAMVTQGALLRMLGIELRAERLIAAQPARRDEVEAGLHRLTDAAQMGEVFKALAIWAPGAPPPPGFAPIHQAQDGTADAGDA